MQKNQFTVAQYVKLINSALATIPNEQIEIIGEIVDYRLSQGKWVNFDLKDDEEEAKISCFSMIHKISLPIENGLKVKVTGYTRVYPRFGKLSLNVETVELVGAGSLAKAYALLKKKLEAEGLFDIARKRDIPRFPKRIGLITSSGAAAYGDFLRILNNRWSGVSVVHANVSVQGKMAVQDILAAFENFNNLEEGEKPEVLVLTRGGGSLEDLHAFNDEVIARAVFKSSIPVVVGVGHERDESLCDFVADRRASTPSNAAEIVVPNRGDVLREISTMTSQMESTITYRQQTYIHRVNDAARVLERFIDRRIHELKMYVERFVYAFERFRLSLLATWQYIEKLEKNISSIFNAELSRLSERFSGLKRLLLQFDVNHVLKRGFSILRKDGKVVYDVDVLRQGDEIQIQLAKGDILAEVKK